MSAPTPPTLALDAPAVEELVEELELIRAVVNTVARAISAQPVDDSPDFEEMLRLFASNPLTQVIDRLRGAS
jgi:hypothetical protein